MVTKEETFKDGDWVIRIKPGNPANKVTENKCYQIIEKGSYSLWCVDDTGRKDKFDISNFRKALPHEIPKQYAQQNVLETLELW